MRHRLRTLRAKRLSDRLTDVSAWQVAIAERVLPFTMTGVECVLATIGAVEYVERCGMSGAIVKYGVRKGEAADGRGFAWMAPPLMTMAIGRLQARPRTNMGRPSVSMLSPIGSITRCASLSSRSQARYFRVAASHPATRRRQRLQQRQDYLHAIGGAACAA